MRSVLMCHLDVTTFEFRWNSDQQREQIDFDRNSVEQLQLTESKNHE